MAMIRNSVGRFSTGNTGKTGEICEKTGFSAVPGRVWAVGRKKQPFRKPGFLQKPSCSARPLAGRFSTLH